MTDKRTQFENMRIDQAIDNILETGGLITMIREQADSEVKEANRIVSDLAKINQAQSKRIADLERENKKLKRALREKYVKNWKVAYK